MKSNNLVQTERFKLLVDALEKGKYARIAKAIGVSGTFIYQIKDGNSPISENTLFKMCCTYPLINGEYLMEGKGEPFIEKPTPTTRLREAIKKLDLSTKDVDSLLGIGTSLDICYNRISIKTISRFLEIHNNINENYILNGTGAIFPTVEDKLMERIGELQKQIKLLEQTNDLLSKALKQYER